MGVSKPKRQRNTGCVYTGLVGRKMTVPKPRVNRRITRKMIRLTGGPLDGETVRLDADHVHHTLPLAAMKGHPAGRYEMSVWKPEATS